MEKRKRSNIGGMVNLHSYSYEDRGLAGDVKALRAIEVISINHCVMMMLGTHI